MKHAIFIVIIILAFSCRQQFKCRVVTSVPIKIDTINILLHIKNNSVGYMQPIPIRDVVISSSINFNGFFSFIDNECFPRTFDDSLVDIKIVTLTNINSVYQANSNITNLCKSVNDAHSIDNPYYMSVQDIVKRNRVVTSFVIAENIKPDLPATLQVKIIYTFKKRILETQSNIITLQ